MVLTALAETDRQTVAGTTVWGRMLAQAGTQHMHSGCAMATELCPLAISGCYLSATWRGGILYSTDVPLRVMSWQLLCPQQLQLPCVKMVVIDVLRVHRGGCMEPDSACVIVWIGPWLYGQSPWGKADRHKLWLRWLLMPSMHCLLL